MHEILLHMRNTRTEWAKIRSLTDKSIKKRRPDSLVVSFVSGKCPVWRVLSIKENEMAQETSITSQSDVKNVHSKQNGTHEFLSLSQPWTDRLYAVISLRHELLAQNDRTPMNLLCKCAEYQHLKVFTFFFNSFLFLLLLLRTLTRFASCANLQLTRRQ